MEILIKRLNDQAKLPVYDHEAGPGMDLYSAEEASIEPGGQKIVSTGIAAAIPVGYVGLVWEGGGKILSDGFRNLASIIDSGFREEIKVKIANTSSETITLPVGSVIGEMIVQKVEKPSIIEAEELSGTEA